MVDIGAGITGYDFDPNSQLDSEMRGLLNRKQEKVLFTNAPPSESEGSEGDIYVANVNGAYKLYIKTTTGWYFSDMISSSLSPGGEESPPLKNTIHREVTLTETHNVDNTSVMQVSGLIIPYASIITQVGVGVKRLSNTGVFDINVWVNTSNTIAIRASVASGGTEILGASITDTESTDSASAADISVGATASDLNEIWIYNTDGIRLHASNNSYVYIANAGTGNPDTGTASTPAIIKLYIEYISTL
jgi:hypothetical protein